MAKMTLRQLNELLERALNQLGDDQLTLVRYQDPTRPLLPESYWRDQHEAAKAKAAELWERSLQGAAAKAARRERDDKLERASASDLMAQWDEDIPTLQGDNETLRAGGWGSYRMAQKGYAKKPTPGSHQPRYPWECYQCGRPITADGKDHAGRYRCDGALMDKADCYPDHQRKPRHGEEEDE